jgi:hypothetical protein
MIENVWSSCDARYALDNARDDSRSDDERCESCSTTFTLENPLAIGTCGNHLLCDECDSGGCPICEDALRSEGDTSNV